MSLPTGTRIGPYEISALLGVGGMGEVYRAHDTRLKRDVALKLLPPSYAADPQRLARFQREAEVLASLDHPHIGAIYGIEESGETRALVLQLVEGETLADRIARGPIPLGDAMPMARQIAEALEAAHEQGVIHRDLKPANVKVTPDGVVKVLDFGLAKLVEPGSEGGAGSAMSQAPTITSPALLTGAGMLLGTAAYMSPEQAKGRPADKRSDVWAFGCLLYEMLSGRRAFPGDDVADTLAAVLRGEPDWNALPNELPPPIVTLIKRCVERDRHQRVSDVAAVLYTLRELPNAGRPPVEGVAAVRPSLFRKGFVYAFMAAVVAAATSAAWWWSRPIADSPPITRFAITLTEGQRFITASSDVLAISPDGTKLAYQTSSGLHVRSMADTDAREVPTGGLGINAVFSPDGEWLAFYSASSRTLSKMPVAGGAPIILCPMDEAPSGIAWHTSGILFGNRSILRVPDEGGASEVLIRVEENESAGAPVVLPGGDAVMFTLARFDDEREGWAWDQAQVAVQSLSTGRRTVLVEGASDARYVSTGHLVYAVSGVLFARSFDVARLQVGTRAVPVVLGVRRGGGLGMAMTARTLTRAQYDVSESGTLVYVAGPPAPSTSRMQLVLADRDGRTTALPLPPGPYQTPRASPDGRWVAFEADDGRDAGIWIHDLAGTTAPRRLTLEGRNRFPVWSGDSRWLAFQSDREGDFGLFRQRADGSTKAERLTKADPGTSHSPDSWSPDGASLLFTITKDSDASLQVLSLADRSIRAFPGVRTTSSWPNAVFSPDGRRIAYSIREPDDTRGTVYVEPFPPTGEKQQVAAGAHNPLWSRDGRQLFFIDPGRLDSGRVGFSAVTVENGQAFSVSQARPTPRPFIISGPAIGRSRTFDVLPDGRFVGTTDEPQQGGEPPVAQIDVVLNWTEELKRLVPAP